MAERILRGYCKVKKYILRLDDACERMDVRKWNRVEELLDRYGVKPIVGVIPHCEDPKMAGYDESGDIWDKIGKWRKKGWLIAMHGYNHVYSTGSGGMNPVHRRSEFAGEPLEVQREKIRSGIGIMRGHGIDPDIFFAPSHTFDENTLTALREESNIRYINDTIAYDVYTGYGFTFIPQQSGRVRKLPFRTVTFCYHPNMMDDDDLRELEAFIRDNRACFREIILAPCKRKYSLLDRALRHLYMKRHK